MKYMTAGELRGASLVAIVDDVPAGLRLQAASIQADLDRWSHGCSCGERREVDCAAILSGVSADGRTTGSPLSLVVDNAAYRASLEDEAPGQAAVPRPGSADLAGLLATDADDCRSIVEGSSARSQAALIAASAVAREFLAEFGVEIQSYVTRIGAAAMREQPIDFETLRYTPLEIESSRSLSIGASFSSYGGRNRCGARGGRHAWRRGRRGDTRRCSRLGVVSRRRHDGPPVEGGVFRE